MIIDCDLGLGMQEPQNCHPSDAKVKLFLTFLEVASPKPPLSIITNVSISIGIHQKNFITCAYIPSIRIYGGK